ncbi:MAG: thioredoxin domain-containing protein [Myxococcales bacterium]|nr:thioredoxin domain-containing protein [Myxococcales bacterium]
MFLAGLALGAVLGATGSAVFLRTGQVTALEARVAALETGAGDRVRQARVDPDSAARVEVSTAGAPIRGKADAPITVVAFSDFQCPYCARVNPTLLRLLAEYPDQVRLVFRHSPLAFHTQAPLAHKAALAAERQGRFWEMHDRIFANPRQLDRDTLFEHAAALRLDRKRFEQDLADPALETVLARDKAEAEQLGVAGTPTFFINGRMLSGAQRYESFKALIDSEIAQLVARG